MLNQYEKDFYGWILANTSLLRQGRFNEVDMENLIEELETLGKSNKREMVNRLAVLVCHLLKWQFQNQRQTKSWLGTIKEQRYQIDLLIEDSPSLQSSLEEALLKSYPLAVLKAEQETGMENKFPKECPYTIRQCLDHSFYPQ